MSVQCNRIEKALLIYLTFAFCQQRKAASNSTNFRHFGYEIPDFKLQKDTVDQSIQYITL